MKTLEAKINSDLISLFSPYDPDLVISIKEIPGRRWNPDQKCWTVPLRENSIREIKKLGFSLDSQIIDWEKEQNKIPDQIDPAFCDGRKLYPFQKEGVAFLEKKNGRALIADEMGLGKTLMAIGYLRNHPDLRPVVVVCPAILKRNWANEIKSCLGLSDYVIEIINGKKVYDMSLSKQIIIVNYDILSTWWKILHCCAQVIILDESHYIKNYKSQRTKATIQLCKKKRHVIALSGTPIINRPIEAYNTIKILDPSFAPSRRRFGTEFCGLFHNGFGWDYSGATNTSRLHETLSDTIMIRRLKKDVLTDLPPKQRFIVPLEIDNKSKYNKMRKEFLDSFYNNYGADHLTHIEEMKQICIEGKKKQAIDWIKNFLESDEKLIVFCTHKATIKFLMEKFSEISIKIDGSTPNEKRQNLVKRFQIDPKIRLFIGNIKAAGVGITLTAASSVCFLELGWSPGEHDQCEDRTHRITQDKSVNIYYLLAENTIEIQIAKLLDRKREILSQVLDGKETSDFSLLDLLIETIQKEEKENENVLDN